MDDEFGQREIQLFRPILEGQDTKFSLWLRFLKHGLNGDIMTPKII